MRNVRLEPPRISRPLLHLFSGYVDWYLRRNFHSIRLSGSLPRVPAETPVIVVLNHPSWWDPLIALTLSQRLFPQRSHYAPIEAAALHRYRFFGKLGFFGIEPGTAAGAARFLRMGQAILTRPGSALWVTAQGTFADPRVRPVALREGVGHLVRRLSGALVLPVALEYPFWEEKYPEALLRIGDPVAVADGSSLAARQWTAMLSNELARTQDLLAADSVSRNIAAFRVLTTGRAGVGGIYDLWRAVRSTLRGDRFRRAHGAERW